MFRVVFTGTGASLSGAIVHEDSIDKLRIICYLACRVGRYVSEAKGFSGASR